MMGAKIKQQARAKGPDGGRRAAEAIQPRFEAIVDQFAERLSGFVESAGETLYRGISEVLDQALAERQDREKDVTRLGAELEGRLTRLKGIEESLTQLRTGVWSE